MRKKGYTLIEVLCVLIVLAVLAAIAIPRLGLDFTVKMKVKTTAQRLTADLRLTRHLAVTNNENYRLTVDASAKEYRIYDTADTQAGETRNIDSVITISADTDFIFESLGNASSAGDTGISLSAEGHQADITVTTATGMITVSGP